ncbi:maleylpyruvate isomerase N-terminal domain-containing protein [Thalassiella azotivora]
MAPRARDLVPEPGERGLASCEPVDVAALLGPAWDGLVGMAADADLDAQTRLPGWTVRHVLVHLGRWDVDERRLERLVADARAGTVGTADDTDARNAGVVAAHHDASRAEVVGALEAARDAVLALLRGPEGAELGRRPVASVVGPLPLAGLLVAQAYELAVHGLDVADATAGTVPEQLLGAGVAGMTDVVGALSARHRVAATFAVATPQGCWATGSAEDGSWTTIEVDLGVRPARLGWPALAGEASDVLEAASGRALAAQLLATRRLRVHHPAGLVRLLPALRDVPGLPGGSALEASLGAIGQTGRLLARVSAGVTGGVTSVLRRD